MLRIHSSDDNVGWLLTTVVPVAGDAPVVAAVTTLGGGGGLGVVADFSACGCTVLQHRLDCPRDGPPPITGTMYLHHHYHPRPFRVGVLALNPLLGLCVSRPVELGMVGHGILHELPADTHITFHRSTVLLIDRSDGRRSVRVASHPPFG